MISEMGVHTSWWRGWGTLMAVSLHASCANPGVVYGYSGRPGASHFLLSPLSLFPCRDAHQKLPVMAQRRGAGAVSSARCRLPPGE